MVHSIPILCCMFLYVFSLSLQYAVDHSRHTFSRSSMDITVTDGGGSEPVTPDELDELLKGLNTFGDMDYG